MPTWPPLSPPAPLPSPSPPSLSRLSLSPTPFLSLLSHTPPVPSPQPYPPPSPVPPTCPVTPACPRPAHLPPRPLGRLSRTNLFHDHIEHDRIKPISFQFQ